MSAETASLSRRDLFKQATAAAAALGLESLSLSGCEGRSATLIGSSHTMIGVPFEPHEVVRLGIIGVGLRGTALLKHFLAQQHLRVTAVCDVVRDKCDRASAMIQAAGQPAPAIYAPGDHDFEQLVRRDDIDFLYIATPWEWHLPQVLAGLSNGKHVGVEVPAVYRLEDCWTMVDASERSRRHCMLMENCCYSRTELAVLNMIHAGRLGDLIHGECAYNHDLRKILFEQSNEGLWRRRHHILRDGNLYPTHGLGPLANYLGIHRGDRFEILVSMSSGHLGLEAYRDTRLPAEDTRRREVYRCGDDNTSLLKTALGRTVMLQHNVSNPRPYDRINLIQGTKAIFRDYPARIFFDTETEEHWPDWQPFENYSADYEHSLWKTLGEMAYKVGTRGGHGAADYIMCNRLVECLRQGLPPDIDVYDAAAWSAAGALSVESVSKGSAPVTFPDFTRGRWRSKRPWEYASVVPARSE